MTLISIKIRKHCYVCMSQRKLKKLAGAKNLGYCNVIGYNCWLWNLSHYSQYSVIEISLVLVDSYIQVQLCSEIAAYFKEKL